MMPGRCPGHGSGDPVSCTTDPDPTPPQSRIIKALAGGAILQGTTEGLSERLGVSPEAFRLALRDLLAGGRVFVSAGRGGDLVIGRERRVRDGGRTA